ncbi:DUF3800 domain-containing protein [Adhaeribacter aquaticus]|uniref:DUF3800 domain-containing protein n=1 Tax=Adhaeribacter aquaticus TaxID=299567 RepID=UPI00054FB26D|nr:DUF3800 domain-containing protein [Adhaeribacter aquaticus]
MRSDFNIYCDESCHLENDNQRVMVLGLIWCNITKKEEIFNRIKEIKAKHGLSPAFEIKWHKVSPAKKAFYLDLIDYFFDDDDLHFRALLVPDKTALNHSDFGQTHDEFYYKMYFDLLKVVITPKCGYNIYIDIKDTRGREKIKRLEEVLRSSNYDFSKNIIRKIQEVKSDEVALLQLADLLIGAVSYLNRGLSSNLGKVEIIKKIQKRSGYSLQQSTLPTERKVNIFRWQSGKRRMINGL